MYSYLPIKIYERSTDLYKAAAVLLKDYSGMFYLISNTDCFHTTGLPSGVSFSQQGLHTTRLFLEPTASMITALIRLRRLEVERLDNYRIVAAGTTASAQECVPLDYDAVIAALESPTASTPSVTGPSTWLVKSEYRTEHLYSGRGSYHSHDYRSLNQAVTADKPWRIGVELEMYARSRSSFSEMTSARSNWFYLESDGSLGHGGDCMGLELITVPLRACDAKDVNFWDEPMRQIGRMCSSRQHSQTGLHVHIGREILGNTAEQRSETLGKLLTFYHYHILDNPAAREKNSIIFGRERCFNDRGAAKTEVGDFAKMIGFEKVESSQAGKLVGETLVQRCRNDRYFDINTTNVATIEFRKGKGAISRTRIAGIITWCEQMCLYCRDTEFHQMSFEGFFNKVTRENACVARWFESEEEL